MSIYGVFSSLKMRFSIVFLVIVLSLYFILPVCFPNLYKAQKELNLGLDLVGGSYVQMDVDFDSYIKSRLSGFISEIKTDISSLKYNSLGIAGRKIVVTFSSIDLCKSGIQKIGDLDRRMYKKCNGAALEVGYSSESEKELRSAILSESIYNIRHRLDSYGTKEISIQSKGSESILIQVPGVYNIDSVKSLIGTTAKLSFHLMADRNKKDDIITLKDDAGNSYDLLAIPEFGGESIVSVFPSKNKFGKFAVSFKLDPVGTKKFADVTKQNIGKVLAIVLDDKVITAPVINEAVLGGYGEISGNGFTFEKVKELSSMLSFGSLPASVNIVSERAIDAMLGAESVKNGKYALVGSIALVSLTMILIYGLFGVFAVISLWCNILLVFASLIIIGATITLPGLAGIALTVGMAVDANILIFERIREQLWLGNGRKLFGVVKTGFEGAMATIIDSNVTTLVAAAVMCVLGSGLVRGFALTLSIGIGCSMFSAIFMTRLMIDSWLKMSSHGERIVESQKN